MKSYRNFMVRAFILAGVFGSSVAFAQSASSTTVTSAGGAAKTNASTSSCALMDPQVFTQNAVNQVLGVLTKDQKDIAVNFLSVQQDIQDALTPTIGITTMSQFVVPPSIWSAASGDDQQAFNVAFLKFIINLYSTPLKNFSNQVIKVYPTRVDWKSQGRVQINSMIQNPSAGPGADIPVSFILQKNGCSWLFIDFVVDNISALANLQQQVLSISKNMQNPTLSALTAVIVKHNASTS